MGSNFLGWDTALSSPPGLEPVQVSSGHLGRQPRGRSPWLLPSQAPGKRKVDTEPLSLSCPHSFIQQTLSESCSGLGPEVEVTGWNLGAKHPITALCRVEKDVASQRGLRDF